MAKGITWVGMDAHKKFINVALLQEGKDIVEWRVNIEPGAVHKLARRINRMANGSEVRCCYEAGPCGYSLKRQIEEAAPLICEVIAPSLIPKKPGERVKTDRKDARKLAELLRSGLLTEVHPPTEAEESVKDLCRCREAIRDDLMRARHRLSKFILRRGLFWGRSNWIQAHHDWLRRQKFDDQIAQAVFDEYLLEVEHLTERLRSVMNRIEAISQSEPYKQYVGWLRCFCGIDTTVAMTVLAELHDFRRFNSPRELMGYLGMTPSEHSSGEARRGGITKTGNSHVRRVLIESAWHYRCRPNVGANLRKRREGQPGAVVAIADKAHQRLSRRFFRLQQRGKPHNKVVVAVARELVGFIWALLHKQASSM